jgi:hypothetical protein
VTITHPPCDLCGKELLLTLSGNRGRCYRCSTGREPRIARASEELVRGKDPIRSWATWRRLNPAGLYPALPPD